MSRRMEEGEHKFQELKLCIVGFKVGDTNLLHGWRKRPFKPLEGARALRESRDHLCFHEGKIIKIIEQNALVPCLPSTNRSSDQMISDPCLYVTVIPYILCSTTFVPPSFREGLRFRGAGPNAKFPLPRLQPRTFETSLSGKRSYTRTTQCDI